MPLQNFGLIAPSIYRSAQPDAHGLSVAMALGVRMILKLNTREEAPEPMLPGVVVWEYPLRLHAPEDVATVALVGQLADAVRDGQVVLAHCTHGRDRVGFVSAAYQILILGWTLEAALAERSVHGVDNFISHLTNASFTEALERLAA